MSDASGAQPDHKKEANGASFGLCCGGNSHQASAGPDIDDTEYQGVRHLKNHTIIELKKMALVPYTGKKPLIHLEFTDKNQKKHIWVNFLENKIKQQWHNLILSLTGFNPNL
jgi:hypothetical protein